MSDTAYSKAPKASKTPTSKPANGAASQVRTNASARPADGYEEFEDEYDEYEDYDDYDDAYADQQGAFEYEREPGAMASRSRMVILGLSALALLVVFSAIIWLLSAGTPKTLAVPEGATGGVPVIQGFVQTTEAQAPTKGAFAPDFMWKDTDGQTVALSSFRGNKPIFVNFWGTWCPPCRQEMPAMESFYQKHKDQIQMVGVSMAPRDDPNIVLNFVRDANYSWKFVHDGDYKIADKYQIASVPSSFFIDRNGIVKAVQVGAMNEAQIENYFQQVK